MEYFGISHEDCPTFALYDLEAMSKYKPATAQADMSAMFEWMEMAYLLLQSPLYRRRKDTYT